MKFRLKRVGVAGILAFCRRNHEKQATTELLNILNEYHSESATEKATKSEEITTKLSPEIPNNSTKTPSNLSVEDAFKLELLSLKTPKFKSIPIDIECCLFIQCPDSCDPVCLVSKIVKDIKINNVRKTRYIHRILPAQDTCLSYMENIIPMAKNILNHLLTLETSTYAIIYNKRNNNNIQRDDLIREIAGIIGDKHVVNLKNPNYCIIVEIYKNTCAMSVVTDFYKLKKFNIDCSEIGGVVETRAKKRKFDEEPLI